LDEVLDVEFAQQGVKRAVSAMMRVTTAWNIKRIPSRQWFLSDRHKRKFGSGINAYTVDISLDGARIFSQEYLIVGTIIGIVFVMRYAERVKKDPTKSLIYDMKAENEKQFMSGNKEGTEFAEFTTRHKVILLFFFLAFVVMVYGVIPWADLAFPSPPGGGGSPR
jgi:hypothetical protein